MDNMPNFSLPVSLEPYTLMYQRPQELTRALLFINPFTPMVFFTPKFKFSMCTFFENLQAWLSIFIAVVAMGPILWIIHRASYYYRVSESGFGGLGQLKHCIWYCYGSVLQQGSVYLLAVCLLFAKSAVCLFFCKVAPCCPRLTVGGWWLDFGGSLLSSL